MGRKLNSKALIGSGLFACLAATGMAQGVQVEVNGQRVYFEGARPQMIGGRVMVPLRGVLEQLGAYVDWDSGTRMVSARKGTIDINMRVGDRSAIVNGRTTYLDAPAMIVRGSTLVPLRFMSEALGADVDWMAQTNTVRINTMDVSEPPNYPPNFPPNNPPATGRASIATFNIEAPGGVLRTGDMVHMELRGTPGADVIFSVPGVTATKRMREESPGVYVADWTVPAEANGMGENSVVAKLSIGNDERTIRGAFEPGNNRPSRDRTPPTISVMEPTNGARMNRARPMIRVRVTDESGLNLDSWRLTLDGDDVTDQAGYSNGMITYQPSNRLSQGTHTVRLEIQDRSGNRASSSWQFEVTRDNDDRRDATFTHDFQSDWREGDVINFTVRAEPRARVTYSIGNVMLDRVMTESTPGVYTARYRLRRQDDFTNLPIVAHVQLEDGTTYTVQAEPMIGTGPNSRTPATPVILTPTGSRVGNSMILRARSADADRFEVKVTYTATLENGRRVTGTVHQRTYEADAQGNLSTDTIDLGVPVGRRNVEYQVTVTALNREGIRSDPATMTIRR